MAITVTTHLPGLPAEAYDSIAAQQAEPLRAAPGFVSHAATVSAEGVTVVETWEERENWQQFFDERVKPHLPPGLPAPTVVELHNVIAR
jgi:heme-degrading monooxygenase HmoA